MLGGLPKEKLDEYGYRAIENYPLLEGTPAVPSDTTVRFCCTFQRALVLSEIGKQSPKTLLDAFERYIEGYITLSDAL